MGVHVDDTAVGGDDSPQFRRAIQSLKTRFPYRKWRVNEGEFCGAYYHQDVGTKEITMSQQAFCREVETCICCKKCQA